MEVQERLGGSLAVYYQGQCVATKPAPATAPVLRARSGARPKGVRVVSTPASRTARPAPQVPLAVVRAAKPAATHPWRRPFKEPRD